MTLLVNKVRGCDQFGATIGLNYAGNSEFKTLGGGISSICLRVLILTYLCMQAVQVATYQDPQIAVFTIKEDRA